MKVQTTTSINRIQQPRTQASSGPDRGRHNTGSERVAFSTGARRLMEAKAPEVPDESRIMRLRAAIEDGSFVIDADTIAARMLEEEV